MPTHVYNENNQLRFCVGVHECPINSSDVKTELQMNILKNPEWVFVRQNNYLLHTFVVDSSWPL